jgi:hypothetical protein
MDKILNILGTMLAGAAGTIFLCWLVWNLCYMAGFLPRGFDETVLMVSCLL